MLLALLITAHALWAPPPVAPPAAPPTTALPAAAPPAAAPPAEAPPALPVVAAPGSRAAAEDATLKDLVPPPLTEAQIRALGAKLGGGPDSAEALRDLCQRYEARTRQPYERAVAAVRPRLAIAYTPGAAGTLHPEPGPELVTALEASAAWRQQLVDADAELLRLLLVVRGDEATATPNVLAYQRTMERDDLLGTDPTAALRLPALLDTAQLPAAERQRAELALDRAWQRTAAAMAARRRTVLQCALRRAQLWAEWGPAWELTASAAQAEARRKQLAEVDARERTAEQELAVANREAVIALLRTLPADAAARVRDVVDVTVWPHLFAQEKLLAQAVDRAAAGADPALLPAMQAVLAEMQRKLEGTRRELSRRAAKVDDLDSVLAAANLGQHTDATSGALVAQLELMDLSDRRRKTIRETAKQLRQMALSAGVTAAGVLDERLTALDAEQRTAQWLRTGLEARLQELGGTSPETEPPPAETPSATEPATPSNV